MQSCGSPADPAFLTPGSNCTWAQVFQVASITLVGQAQNSCMLHDHAATTVSSAAVRPFCPSTCPQSYRAATCHSMSQRKRCAQHRYRGPCPSAQQVRRWQDVGVEHSTAFTPSCRRAGGGIRTVKAKASWVGAREPRELQRLVDFDSKRQGLTSASAPLTPCPHPAGVLEGASSLPRQRPHGLGHANYGSCSGSLTLTQHARGSIGALVQVDALLPPSSLGAWQARVRLQAQLVCCQRGAAQAAPALAAAAAAVPTTTEQGMSRRCTTRRGGA